MEPIVERPAALDVHKAQVTACVRMPGDGGAREQHVARVPDDGARAVGAGATGWRRTASTQVAMEATGVYWKPVWAILEDDFELHAGQRAPRQAGGVGLALLLLSDVVLEQSSLVGFDLDS